MPMTQVCVKTARKIDRAVSSDHAALGTHACRFHTTAAVSSLWSPRLLYELPANGILLLSLGSMRRADPNPSDRVATCSTGIHSLFHSIIGGKKATGKSARARERINKGKHNPEVWFALSRMRYACACSFFINFANLSRNSVFAFPCLLSLNNAFESSMISSELAYVLQRLHWDTNVINSIRFHDQTRGLGYIGYMFLTPLINILY